MKFTLLALTFASSLAFAAAPKTYQVTGTVVDVSDSKITVDKAGEKFEMDRSPAAKVTGGDIAKGAKVTVSYSLTAQSIDVKADKAAAKKK